MKTFNNHIFKKFFTNHNEFRWSPYSPVKSKKVVKSEVSCTPIFWLPPRINGIKRPKTTTLKIIVSLKILTLLLSLVYVFVFSGQKYVGNNFYIYNMKKWSNFIAQYNLCPMLLATYTKICLSIPTFYCF